MSGWVGILVSVQSVWGWPVPIDIDGAVPQREGWIEITPSRFVVVFRVG